MKFKRLPDVQYLRSILSYDPKLGVFTRTATVSSTAQKGSIAGSKKLNGRITIRVLGVPYEAHRMAWLMYYGEEPSGEIDHKNRRPDDNRICNLRCVTHAQNAKNRSVQTTNSSGVTGVQWHKRAKRWYAVIRSDGVRINVGCFKDKASAVAARKDAEAKYFNHNQEGATQ